MSAVETAEPKAKGKGGKKKAKRVGVRIDMTPMVDVCMLLLTFFMLTTVFNKPQTMELNLPPDAKVKVEVQESALITLRVAANFSIYWNKGSDLKMEKLTLKELRAFLVEQSRSNPKLVVLIKINRDATYNNMVDLMDEVNLANITRFSLVPMDDADKALMAKAG
jgi:biopolymer transport protein ExbD